MKKQKLKEHHLTVDKTTPKDDIDFLVSIVQKDFPNHKIIVSFREDDKDFDSRPSKITSSFWVTANRKIGDYPSSSENSGKWLIFALKSEIDLIWQKIKEATENGILGNNSKVSTAKDNPNSSDKNRGVICVYSYDWTDKNDVIKIREELRKLGVIQKIPYKADNDTSKGKYVVKGDKGISQYYE